VEFKIFTALTIMMMLFGLSHHVDWLVEVSVSEKPAVSIFRVEMITSALKMETARRHNQTK
jgi:uncharacterized membrane protein